MTDRIAKLFADVRGRKRACFVSYICAGDPDFETSLEVARTLIETGTEILELGVPFSDPLADGLTNQLAAERALTAGMTQQKVYDLVRAIRGFSDIPIIFYTYYNLACRQGVADYARRAKEAGVDGVLMLDLPPEEAEDWLAAAAENQIATVFIVAPTTPPDRIRRIAGVTTGFIYYVSREGVTGERRDLAANLEERVGEIRKVTDVPLVVGFGVSTADHVAAVSGVADGVVVGSALVNCIHRNVNDRDAILRELRERAQTLVAGIRAASA